jgi:hypothetical protein
MALEDALVAILGRDGKPSGAGFLILPDLVLTCAHVVNAAIGRSKDAAGRPPKAKIDIQRRGGGEIISSEIHSAEDAWSDPPASRCDGADLCILSLTSIQSDVKAPRWRVYASPSMKPFRTAGFPENWGGDLDIAEGHILGRDFGPGNLYMLSTDARGDISSSFFTGQQRRAGAIHAGFSGGPVEGVGGRIIGLIAETRSASDMTAYMIPVEHFPKSVVPKRKRFRNPVEEKFRHVENLTSSLAKMFLSEQEPFDLRLRFCDDFQQVLDAYRHEKIVNGKQSSPITDYNVDSDLVAKRVAEILRTDEALKPVLLHAPGGSGKSSFLAQLLLSAPAVGLVPFFIDFSKGEKGGASNTADPKQQLADWFNRTESWGDPAKLLALADDPPEQYKALLVIDGVNQLSLRWNEVLATAQTLSRGALAGATVVIADRMTDRGSAMREFTHAVIPPLPATAYRRALSQPLQQLTKDRSWWTILASPLFLDLLLLTVSKTSRGKKPIPSRFKVLNRYFRETCNLGDSEIKLLSDFAFEMYKMHKQTAIPSKDLHLFYERNGSELREKIESKELVRQLGDDGVEFKHQILHDWLAALKLASSVESEDEILLRAPAFSIVSLDGASIDPIELGLEALQYPADLLQQRDRPLETREMLAAVFDWNYWITFQCVASFDRRGESPLPGWVRHAIYAHNLEKQFDPFFHTALFAEQLKSQIPAEISYARATSRTGITSQIEAILRGLDETDTEKEYRDRWLDIYLRSTPFTRADLESLWEDPFLSWTAANVIRRFDISREITDELVRLYQVSKKTSDSAPRPAMFRWRIVHALGKADAVACKQLLAIAFDAFENMDVRYGAIRSLFELAATGREKTDLPKILGEVHSRCAGLFLPKSVSQLRRVRRELRRMCALNEPHVTGRDTLIQDWLTVGLPLYIKILQRGAELAEMASLPTEAALWKAWQLAAEQASRADNWEARRPIWQDVIEKDP